MARGLKDSVFSSTGLITLHEVCAAGYDVESYSHMWHNVSVNDGLYVH